MLPFKKTGAGVPLFPVSHLAGTPTTLGQGGGVAAAPSLPSGAIGYWDANNYTTTGRDRVPNSLGNGLSDDNLIIAPRRLFSGNDGINQCWSFYNCTISDCDQVAPDGSTEASTLSWGAAATWGGYHRMANLPAGTFTLAVTVKDLGGGGAQFQMGVPFAYESTKTTTTSYARYTHTFTNPAPAPNADVGMRVVGAAAGSLAIVDMELFAGSSDLNTTWATLKPQRIRNADLICGRYDGTAGLTVSNREFAMGSGFWGHLQLAAAQTPSAVTLMFTGKRQNATASTWEAILCQAQKTGKNYDTFDFGQDVIAGPDIALAGSGAEGSQANDGLMGGCQQRYTWGITYDGVTQKTYVNGALVRSTARSTPIPEFLDFVVGWNGFGAPNSSYSSYNFGALAVWPRALSAAEVLQAGTYAEQNRTMPTKRLVILEGDSITAQQTARVGYNLSNPGFGWDHALINSSTIGAVSLDNRKAMVKAAFDSATSGTTKILTVLIGANDLSGAVTATWLANLAAYCDYMRAGSIKVVVCTVLPKDGDASHNTNRATVNTAIKATWIGLHCDAIADYAANATMGPDNSYSVNPTKWTDGVHPNTAGHDILVPILAAAIDSL